MLTIQTSSSQPLHILNRRAIFSRRLLPLHFRRASYGKYCRITLRTLSLTAIYAFGCAAACDYHYHRSVRYMLTPPERLYILITVSWEIALMVKHMCRSWKRTSIHLHDWLRPHKWRHCKRQRCWSAGRGQPQLTGTRGPIKVRTL